MLYKDAPGATEVSEADGGRVCGYASTFDREPDSYGDVVAKGAFARSLERWESLGKPIPLLYGHNTSDPKYNVGAVTVAREDDRGLYVEAEFDAESEKAQQVRRLVRTGRLYQFSFAYDVLDAGEVELEDGTKANELRELRLFEVSLVQIPANQHAEVTDVKGAKAGRRNSASDEQTIRQAIDLLRSLLGGQDEIGEGDGGGSEGGEGRATPKGREEPVTIPLAEYKRLIMREFGERDEP